MILKEDETKISLAVLYLKWCKACGGLSNRNSNLQLQDLSLADQPVTSRSDGEGQIPETFRLHEFVTLYPSVGCKVCACLCRVHSLLAQPARGGMHEGLGCHQAHKRGLRFIQRRSMSCRKENLLYARSFCCLQLHIPLKAVWHLFRPEGCRTSNRRSTYAV